MAECTHDCSTCSSKDCKERGIQKEKQNEFSKVKKVIGIVSGKGGVGKSLVTSLLAVAMAKIKDLQGVTGATTFDDKHNPIKSAVIIEHVDGKQTFKTKINP